MTNSSDTPVCETLAELESVQWHRSWESISKYQKYNYTCDLAIYRNIKIANVCRVPGISRTQSTPAIRFAHLHLEISNQFSLNLYAEKGKTFADYHAWTSDTSANLDDEIGYILFEWDTPLETVVKFIDSYIAGNINGISACRCENTLLELE